LETKVWPGKWHVVSGKIEGEEKEDDCLKREVSEEINIEKFKILRKVFYNDFQVGSSYKVFLYLCEILEGEIRLSDENTEYKWVDVSEINEMDITPAIVLDLKELGLIA
jgi:8-oxo-dGTP diphosphatase